jgi:hypothetical protein
MHISSIFFHFLTKYSAQDRVFIIMADFRSPGGMTQCDISRERIDSRGDDFFCLFSSSARARL